MRATWGFAFLLLAFATSASADADLQVTSAASPTTGLSVGQDVLVTTTMRNNGPHVATNPIGIVSFAAEESSWFQFVGSETPDCAVEQVEVDPPALVLGWGYPTLPAGHERTCVVRLRVQLVPPTHSTNVFAAVGSDSPDLVSGNGLTSTALFFGAVLSPTHHTIPSTSRWGLALLGIGLLALAARARCRRRA